MTIHSSDVKLFESQRITHEEDGSGRDTGKDSKQKKGPPFSQSRQKFKGDLFLFFLQLKLLRVC